MPEADAETTTTGLLICDDLFFSSKVTGTADALGLKVNVIENVDELPKKLSESSYRCVILDLTMPGLNPAEVMSAMPSENRPAVIAFGSHVMTARLQEARDAGCDEVMPKSQFSGSLPEILKRVLRN
ncbi:MAG: response regulator [Planctomycetes bacterium]|nr:response regulator [Planctomycetota bacterium]